MRTRLRESDTIQHKGMLPATFVEVIETNGGTQYLHGQFFDSREEAEEDYERRLERL